MHTGVHTKMSTEMPTKFEDCSRTHHGVPTKTPMTALTGNLAVHTKMYTKRARTQLLVRQGLAAYSHAKRQASTEMWAHLACLVLRAAWQSIAECLPPQATARPSQPCPAGPDSHPARLDFLSSQARPDSLLSCPHQGWQPRWASSRAGVVAKCQFSSLDFVKEFRRFLG